MTDTQPPVIPLFQWAAYCEDTKALRDRNLGVGNCLVCGQEPCEVVVKECPASHAHAGRDVLGHVAWVGCGHQAEVEFTGSPLDRAVAYGVQS
jgi:hypothetical protein